jgi:hypothetical protein
MPAMQAAPPRGAAWIQCGPPPGQDVRPGALMEQEGPRPKQDPHDKTLHRLAEPRGARDVCSRDHLGLG